MLLQMLAIPPWKEKTAYMMKVVGEESYVIRVEHNIRVVDGSNLGDVVQPITAFEVIKTGEGEYSFLFCDKYLSAKDSDPGVVPLDIDFWGVEAVGKGYKLKNKASGECLTKTDQFDPAFNGNFAHRMLCDSAFPNVFTFYEMGDIDFYCKRDAGGICAKLGFSLGDLVGGNLIAPEVLGVPTSLVKGGNPFF